MQPIDTAQLDRLANTLRKYADQLRVSATSLSLMPESTAWVSLAGNAFTGQVDTLSRSLTRGATDLENAAAALQAHVQTALERERLVVEAAQAAAHAAEAAAKATVHAVGTAAHAVDNAAETAAHAVDNAAETAAHALGHAASSVSGAISGLFGDD